MAALVVLGRWDEADVAIEELPTGAPTTVELEACIASARGDFLAALRLLEGSATIATRTRARVLAILGRVDEALETLERGLDLFAPRKLRERAMEFDLSVYEKKLRRVLAEEGTGRSGAS